MLSINNKTHLLFIVSVISKGIAGVIETIGGVLLFAVSGINSLVLVLIQHELGEDPTDLIAQGVKEFLPYISVSTEVFAAWYFLIHGIVNLVLVFSLLRKRLWSYPLAIGVDIAFMFYQLYRFTHTHSPTLIILSSLDLLVVLLIWREYQFLKQTLTIKPTLDNQ